MKLNMSYRHHYGNTTFISAAPRDIFAYIDNHARFSSHMSKSSWMMGGGRMNTSIDSGRGKKVGSHIRMKGKVFGISISLDEIITHRRPPYLKIWATTGAPKLLVIDHYRMKIEIEPRKRGSMLRVSIDYNLPRSALLGRLFGAYYSKWCVEQMIKGTIKYFGKKNK